MIYAIGQRHASERRPKAQAADWLVRLSRATSVKLRLFAFPCAGGSAWMYRQWAGALPDGVELFGMQPPGRGTRISQLPLPHLDALLESAAEALQPYLHAPFAFFGHSLGALISFELARWLSRKHGAMPVHLFVSGKRAPHLPPLSPPLSGLPDGKFLERLRRFEGIPPELLANTEMQQLLLPALRADFAIAETYTYQPSAPLSCPISAFGGDADPDVPLHDLSFWAVHTTGPFSVQTFRGGHFFIQSAGHRVEQAVARSLNGWLVAHHDFPADTP